MTKTHLNPIKNLTILERKLIAIDTQISKFIQNQLGSI